MGNSDSREEDSTQTIWIEEYPSPSSECLGCHAEPQNGRTYTMYNVTAKVAARQIIACGFRQSSDGMLGRGVYVSRNLQKASKYPLDLPEQERVVLKLKVRVGKVKKIDRQGHPLQKTWHAQGYDTAWVPPNCGMVPSGQEEDCVWDPKRITVIDAIRPRPGRESRSRDRADGASYSGSGMNYHYPNNYAIIGIIILALIVVARN